MSVTCGSSMETTMAATSGREAAWWKWFLEDPRSQELLENQVPVKLEAGQTHFIPAYTWHRLLMGKDKLIVEIIKK